MSSTRIASLMVAAICALGPRAASAGNTVRAPRRGCFKPGNKRIGVLQKLASKRTNAAYRAALARRGLHLAHIGGATVTLHRGIYGGRNQRGIPLAKLTTTTVKGLTGRYVGGSTWWSGSAGRPQFRILVTDGKGNYYFVRKRPTLAVTTNVVMCGCARRKCGPYGSGCPACGATVQHVFGPFKDSDRFGGYIDIKYQSYAVSVRYQRGICRPMRRCPPPPPAMRRR